MFIIDAHEDLAWNMATFGRDYSTSASTIRSKEASSIVQEQCEDTLLGWEDYKRGEVWMVFSTLFASPVRRKIGDWDNQCYSTTAEASILYRQQLNSYRRLCEQNPDKFRLLDTIADVTDLLDNRRNRGTIGSVVGLVVLMEGGEAIGHPSELDEWWGAGVRIIGPAWAGTRFCGGTGEPGGLTEEGFALLDSMGDLGFCLDISHMDEQAALQALDNYSGLVIASHANVKSLLEGIANNRHLSDQVIRMLIQRDGMIGIVPVNNFLKVGWKRGDPREEVPLDSVVAHIDYICQLAGDAYHVGFGTDFDGGFGVQSAPEGIDTIADLQKFIPLLSNKGYSQEDVQAIMGGNWLSKVQHVLPE